MAAGYANDSAVPEWQRLIAVTEQLLALSEEDDDFESRLTACQQEQETLREAIAAKSGGNLPADGIVRSMAARCLDLERRVQAKLQAHRQEVNQQIAMLQNADRVRSHYQKAFAQAEGYFIDRHK